MSNRGCQVIAWGVMFLCAIGLLYTGSCTSLFHGGAQGDQAPAQIVAVVAGNQITEKQINDVMTNLSRGLPEGGDTDEPRLQFGIVSMALHQVVDEAVNAALAKQSGVAVTDDDVLKNVGAAFDQSVLVEKQKMIAAKQLKPDASDADFQAAILKMTGGKDLATIREQKMAEVRKALQDPKMRPNVIGSFVEKALLAKYESSVAVDDETLKRAFDQFVVRRLSFQKAGLTTEEQETQAEKALAEIQGGATFEAAMAKYAPGAPKEPTRLSRQAIVTSPDLKPLLDLKPGQTSAVVKEFGVPTIFQLVKVEPGVPKEFAQQKSLFAQAYRQQMASQRIVDERRKLLDSKAMEWKSPAYKLAYELSDFMRTSAFGPQAKEKLKAFAEEAATLDDPIGDQVTALARFTAFETYCGMLSPAEKEQEYETRVEVMSAVLEYKESYTVRLALADLLMAHKDGEQAIQHLQMAAETNRDFGPAAVKLCGDIQARLDKGVKAGVFTAEMAAPVRKELDRWHKDKAEDEKTQAEIKAEEAKAQKEAEEEIRKENEANLKQQAEEKASAHKAAKAPAPKAAGGQ